MKHTSTLLVLFITSLFVTGACRLIKEAEVRESAADMLPPKIVLFEETIEPLINKIFIPYDSTEINLKDTSITEYTGHIPLFPGGTEAWKKYINESIKYPPYARELAISGITAYQFTITQEGKIKNIEILQSVDKDLSNAGIKATRHPRKQTSRIHCTGNHLFPTKACNIAGKKELRFILLLSLQISSGYIDFSLSSAKSETGQEIISLNISKTRRALM